MSNPAYLRRRAAAEYLKQHWGVPCSEKTLAKLACVGGGPVYRCFGRVPLYTPADLDEFARAKIGKPVRSTSEYGAVARFSIVKHRGPLLKGRTDAQSDDPGTNQAETR
jgi:hypothetical protein